MVIEFFIEFFLYKLFLKKKLYKYFPYKKLNILI